MLITSTKNEKVKALHRLNKSSERRKEEVFILEGLREMQRALNAGYSFQEIYYCPSLIEDKTLETIFPASLAKIAVSHNVYETIAYRENKDGILALVKTKNYFFEDLQIKSDPLIVVLEGVEKPGNLGAMLRTADAAGADAIVVCDPKTDIYNPNVIRASIGCVFTKPIICCTNKEAYQFFLEKQVKTLATTPYATELYFNCALSSPLAIIMGTEAEGLSDFWMQKADFKVKVPMLGIADSLNVSVCLSVVIYEAVRQRMLR